MTSPRREQRPSFRVQSPWSPAGGRSLGAIAIVQIAAPTREQLERVLAQLGLPPVAPGDVTLATLAGVDRGLVARFSPTIAQLTPHGSPLLVDRIVDQLRELGIAEAEDTDPSALYPEAGSPVEACALDAIARAASPLALGHILEHRDRWLAAPRGEADAALTPLDHLLDPPTVALVGAPNIGKSSLTNALAQRRVSLVHDEPGVTRDHIGVTLDLAGLSVRWIDTPGLRDAPGDLEREAIGLAAAVIAAADLIVLASDHTAGPPDLASLVGPVAREIPTIRVVLRADLGGTNPGAGLATSAVAGEGLGALAEAVLEALVPRAVRDAPGLWRFHPGLPGATAG